MIFVAAKNNLPMFEPIVESGLLLPYCWINRRTFLHFQVILATYFISVSFILATCHQQYVYYLMTSDYQLLFGRTTLSNSPFSVFLFSPSFLKTFAILCSYHTSLYALSYLSYYYLFIFYSLSASSMWRIPLKGVTVFKIIFKYRNWSIDLLSKSIYWSIYDSNFVL